MPLLYFKDHFDSLSSGTSILPESYFVSTYTTTNGVEIFDVACDLDNNIYLAGRAFNSVYDSYAAKLDSNGTPVWGKSIGAGPSYELNRKIIIHPSMDKVEFFGMYNPYNGSQYSLRALRSASNGATLYAPYTTIQGWYFSAHLLDDGAYFLISNHLGRLSVNRSVTNGAPAAGSEYTFPNTVYTSHYPALDSVIDSNKNIFVLGIRTANELLLTKLNYNTNLVWSKHFTFTGNISANTGSPLNMQVDNGIAIDNNDNVYIAVATSTSTKLMKINNSTGAVEWTKTHSLWSSAKVECDADGNIWLLITTGGAIHLYKYDQTGNLLLSRLVSTASGIFFSGSMCINSAGTVVVACRWVGPSYGVAVVKMPGDGSIIGTSGNTSFAEDTPTYITESFTVNDSNVSYYSDAVVYGGSTGNLPGSASDIVLSQTSHNVMM